MTSCMLRLTSKVPKILLLLPPGQSKEPACQLRRHKRHRFTPWVRKVPWRRAWQPTPVFLPGDSHGQRSLEGCSPWGRRELGTMEQLSSSRTIQWPSAWRQGTLVLCVQTTQQLCTLRPPQVSASPTGSSVYPLSESHLERDRLSAVGAQPALSAPFSLAVAAALRYSDKSMAFQK